MGAMDVKLPAIPKMTCNIKVLFTLDFPNPGDITWVYRAFDVTTGELLTSPVMPDVKACALAAPGQPNKCIMHFINTVPSSMLAYIPAFSIRLLLSYLPKLV